MDRNKSTIQCSFYALLAQKKNTQEVRSNHNELLQFKYYIFGSTQYTISFTHPLTSLQCIFGLFASNLYLKLIPNMVHLQFLLIRSGLFFICKCNHSRQFASELLVQMCYGETVVSPVFAFFNIRKPQVKYRPAVSL
jgi:hypothetical protein